MTARLRQPAVWAAGGCLALAALRLGLVPNGGPHLQVCLAGLFVLRLAAADRIAPAALALDAAFAAAALILTADLAAVAVRQFNWNSGFFLEPNYVTIVESRELLKATLFGRFAEVYTDMSGPPYLITLYPPLFHGLVWISAGFFGPTLTAARLVSLASAAGLLAVVWVLARRLTGSRLLAALATAAGAVCPQVANWSVVGRPDMTAWLFAFASAVLLLPDTGRPPSRLRLAWAGLAMSAALMTKEQTLPFFAAGAAYALWAHPDRRGVLGWYVAPVLVLTGGLSLALNAATHGAYFLNILTYPSLLGRDPGFNSTATLLANAHRLLLGVYPALLAFLAYAVRQSWRLKPDLAVLLFLANLPFHILLLRSWGYDSNYDTCAVLLIYLGAAALAGLFRGSSAFLGAGVLVFSLLMAPHADYSRLLDPNVYQPNINHPADRIADHRANQTVVAALLANAAGRPSLVDAESSYLVLGHDTRGVEYIDAVESGVFARMGLWNPAASRLARDIGHGRFAFILAGRFMPESLLAAIEGTYTPILAIGGGTVYLLK